jgi:hypothetical protein
VKTILLGAGSSVIDMTWERRQCGSIRLLVLSSLGEHILFRICDGNQVDFKDEDVEDMRIGVHVVDVSAPFNHGNITSYEATVASTNGYEVAIRADRHIGGSYPFIFVIYPVDKLYTLV